ncbi:hypothetical protein RI129_002641 [Pyrocoelia pectoralis]|uniref:Farnesyl pyrophosphate synthase n=1 Tax=Pyrocoelia pectoralis TaxID=417401 RepID=A0AAN7VQ07_9COLE
MLFNIIKPFTSLQIIRNVRLLGNISKTSAILSNENITKYMSRPRENFNSRQASIKSEASTYTTSIDECMSCFHELTTTLTINQNKEVADATKRFTRTLKYNVPKGKRNRVRATVTAYKILESKVRLTPENLRLAQMLGWCIELLNAAMLIEDDIMDASTTRRGSPCWYLVEDIGMHALSDAVLVENSVYNILKTYFSRHKCYSHVMDLFHRTTLLSALGQSIDSQRATENGLCNLDFYSEHIYEKLVKYKTHYYTCEFPVRAALYLAEKFDHEQYKSYFQILYDLSYYYQLQNDFLDCFGSASLTGKDGTDIQEGKCTWLIMTALHKANTAQRQILAENYGKCDTRNVSIVRNLFKELKIPETYFSLENNISNVIQERIHNVHSTMRLPDILFYEMMNLMCKNVSNYRD